MTKLNLFSDRKKSRVWIGLGFDAKESFKNEIDRENQNPICKMPNRFQQQAKVKGKKIGCAEFTKKTRCSLNMKGHKQDCQDKYEFAWKRSAKKLNQSLTGLYLRWGWKNFGEKQNDVWNLKGFVFAQGKEIFSDESPENKNYVMCQKTSCLANQATINTVFSTKVTTTTTTTTTAASTTTKSTELMTRQEFEPSNAINTLTYVKVESNVCLKFINKSLTFAKATQQCQKDGAMIWEPKTQNLDQIMRNFAGKSRNK